MRQVACPVALHPDGAPLRVPVFENHLGRFQLVKGGIEPGERSEAAAARELFEESGLETRSAILLGVSNDVCDGERWHFSLCRVVPPVRDRWQHYCADDGGHLLRFHWHPLDAPDPDPFHETFQKALAWIRAAL